MNFNLNFLPERTVKPRTEGCTMVIDKGLSPAELDNFLSISAPYTDFVKLGFGTAVVTPVLEEKLAIFKKYDVPYYFGGTLFEAFIARGQYNDFIALIETYGVKYIEVSDGCLEIPHDTKCRYIRELSQYGSVLSEVGSKDAEKIIAPYRWIEMMEAELEAGSVKIIAEAREAGTAGIFRQTGEVRGGLIEEILRKISHELILWEAPQKSQQVWFIQQLGANVNLGNIPPHEVIALESLRLGLRGDTFHQFLPKKIVFEY